MSLFKGFFRRFRDKTGSSLGLIIAAVLLLEALALAEQFYTRWKLQETLERQSEVALRRNEVILDYTLDMAELTMAEHHWEIQEKVDDPDSLMALVGRLLVSNRQIVGACVSVVPGYYPGKKGLFEPYASRDGSKIVYEDLAAPGDHDYTENPEYLAVLASGGSAWGEPYRYGEDDQADLVTYSSAVRDRSGRIAGVCGLDLDLSWLGDTLNSKHFYPSSFCVALTRDGRYVAGPAAHRDREWIVSLINDPAAAWTEHGRLKSLVFDGKGPGRSGIIHLISLSGPPYWKLATVNYDDEVYAPERNIRLYHLLLGLLSLLLLLFIVTRYVRNTRRLADAQVREARLGSELRVARGIQDEMLPKVYPPFPDRKDLDVYGLLEPAREVGGDLYNFFIRDEKLYFCIGDVSGKGIPSAMVMTVVNSLFRTFSERIGNPARIVEGLNAEACRGNESSMFVTFFLGILDLPTGHLRYCNAGHDHPALIRGKEVRLLDAKANLPVGTFPDTRYEAQECMIEPGTTIFLYTDGLTEAKNVNRQLFSRSRMLQTLENSAGAKDCQHLLASMSKAVRAFIGKADQSDDLTMLAIRYTPVAEEIVFSDSLTLRNDVAQIGALGDFVKGITARLHLDAKPAHDLRLALEEIVVNVMNYAYPGGAAGDVRIDARADAHTLTFVVTDGGIPFDPTEVEMADTTLSVEDRPIGGLGIFLARGLVDSVNYERTGGRNILTLKKKLDK